MTRLATPSFLTPRPSLCALLLALAFGLAAPAQAERPVDLRADARAGGTVEISNLAGTVTVRSWNRDEVRVTGTMGDDVTDVTLERRGSRVIIEVEHPRRSRRGRYDADADLEITMPAGNDLEATTVSARIEVADIDGRLVLTTVSGGIKLEGRPASIEAKTVSGRIVSSADTESLRVESVSGTLELRGRADEVEVDTVSGPVDLTTVGARSLRLDTVSSAVDLDLDLEPGASVDASSHSGSITIRLDADASARIEASSFSGRIHNDLGPRAEKRRYGPGSSLSFSLGRGEGRIELSTFSGSVRIEER